MGAIASQITSLTIVYSIIDSDAGKKKTSKLRVTGLCEGFHRGPMNSPHKWPVMREMFPFDDVIMWYCICLKDNEYEGLLYLCKTINFNTLIE